MICLDWRNEDEGELIGQMEILVAEDGKAVTVDTGGGPPERAETLPGLLVDETWKSLLPFQREVVVVDPTTELMVDADGELGDDRKSALDAGVEVGEHDVLEVVDFFDFVRDTGDVLDFRSEDDLTVGIAIDVFDVLSLGSEDGVGGLDDLTLLVEVTFARAFDLMAAGEVAISAHFDRFPEEEATVGVSARKSSNDHEFVIFKTKLKEGLLRRSGEEGLVGGVAEAKSLTDDFVGLEAKAFLVDG